MKVHVIDITRASGNAERCTQRTCYRGIVADVVPKPSGKGAWLLRPIADCREEIERYERKCGCVWRPLDKFDVDMRLVLDLSQRDAARVLTAPPGTVIEVVQRGWGETFRQTFRTEG